MRQRISLTKIIKETHQTKASYLYTFSRQAINFRTIICMFRFALHKY